MSNGNIAQEFESFHRSRTAPTSLGGEFERFRQEQQRLAELPPIAELQRTFRAAREPVEQTEGVRFPAGAEIKRAPAPIPRGRLGPVGTAYAPMLGLETTPEEETGLREAARSFREVGDQPSVPLTKLLPEGPPTATITGFKQPSKVAEARALVGEGPYPYETPEIPIGGIAKGALEVASGLTTPKNLALIGTLGLTAKALPLASRAISAGFSFELLRGAIQEYPELREAMNTGDEQRVAQVATRMGLTAVLAALTGKHAVREQAEAARRVEGEKLGEEFATPVEERAGKPIEEAPIFRGTEAAPQREMFAPGRELEAPQKAGAFERRTAVDEFGDTIERGGYVVDSLGRRGKVRSVGSLVQNLETGKAVFRGDMLKVDFGKGPEPVSIAEVTVKRHGRPQALEGIGRKPVRYFGETDIAFHERLLRGPEIPEGMHANPVFNPRFWQTADAAIRPFTQKIDSAIGRAVGRLPFSIRRWLRDDPATKRIIQETRRAVGERQSETESVLRMVLRENPTPAELAIADRIARGVPEELSSARPEMRPVLEQAAQEIHGLAQQMTSERSALGLPIREEWVEGPKRWYPNLWRQHLGSPRMIAGRLFAKLTPKRAEMGSLKRRTTDRFTVVDKSGNIARGKAGQQAIFRTKLEAHAFVREHPRRALRVLEPMTHQQAVAHGLIEDLAVNVRHGFSRGWSLVAKTRGAGNHRAGTGQ